MFAPLWKGRVRRQDLRSLTNNTECHERGDDAALMAFSQADGVANYDTAAIEGP